MSSKDINVAAAGNPENTGDPQYAIFWGQQVVSAGPGLLHAIKFNTTDGFLGEYAGPSAPIYTITGVFCRHGNAVFVTSVTTAPFFRHITWDFTSGFGTITTFSPSPSIGTPVGGHAMNSAGTKLFTITQNSPYIYGINCNSKQYVSMWTNTGTAAEMASDARTSIEFSPDGNWILIGGVVSPYLRAYNVSGTSFGTTTIPPNPIYAYPTIPTGQGIGRGLSINPAGNVIAQVSEAANSTSAWVITRTFNQSTGAMGGYVESSTRNLSGRSILFTSNARILVTAPLNTVLRWHSISNVTLGAQVSVPSTQPGSLVQRMEITPDRKALILWTSGVAGTSPITAYRWDDSTGFGTMYTRPIHGPYSVGAINRSSAGSLATFPGKV